MDHFNRRAFLARASLFGTFVGAGVALPGTLGNSLGPVGRANAQTGSAVLDAVEAFSLDTMRGLCVMVMPGPDEWSRQQGTPRTDPGPIEGGGGEFMKDLFDNYLGMGDQLARPLALGIAQALSDMGIQTAPFLGLSEPDGRRIDQVLGYVYSDRVLPLSLPVALLLNTGALLAAPQSIVGPLGSPFSRLSLTDKLRVLEGIEGPVPQLVSIIDGALPVPLRGSASGFLRFAGGILLEGTAFGVYSEQNNYNPATRTVDPRPVPWDLTGYRPNGLVDGHDEFIGYYQNRTEVPADA
ncbi:hypothetical protein [Dietzia psychralcaliphila]|uniref:Uncharacterized protein n=1 Tax=Dietzia psychralcaliphila TaxID=139021 RepID=A0AAD0NR58_9ACTN|nr:hypothetical protein [Dietzia psychralcaliphila]AWH96854.1 hypothetical protein A6048_16675 [Dietzia psychralcaliphila]PTM89510.1 hypothetical protein C8N39_102353 [Dietzia psychralcaliphila]